MLLCSPFFYSDRGGQSKPRVCFFCKNPEFVQFLREVDRELNPRSLINFVRAPTGWLLDVFVSNGKSVV